MTPVMHWDPDDQTAEAPIVRLRTTAKQRDHVAETKCKKLIP